MADWYAPRTGAAGQVLIYFEVETFSRSCYLATAVNLSATTIDTSWESTEYTPEQPLVGDIVQIDDEDMLVSAVDVYSLPGWGYGLTVTRGYGGTTAVGHSVNAGVRIFRSARTIDNDLGVISLPKIKHQAEKKLNYITSSVSTLTMSNSKNQWNDATAFGTWNGRLVRFYWTCPSEDRGGAGVSTTDFFMTTIGTFMIDDIEIVGDVANFTLVSLETPLKESRSAESVKDKGWYQNKSSRFLIRQLLGSSCHSPRSSPPAHWLSDMPDNLELQARSSRPVFSHYGRPPEWDGTAWYQNKESISRAVAFNYVNSSTPPTRLYYGNDTELWYRNLSTNEDVSVGIPLALHKIVRIWASVKEPGVMWVISLRDRLEHGGYTTSIKIPVQSMMVSKVSAAGYISLLEGATVVSGFWSYLKMRFMGSTIPSWYCNGDELMSLPFSQYVRPNAGSPWIDPSYPTYSGYWTEEDGESADPFKSALAWYNDGAGHDYPWYMALYLGGVGLKTISDNGGDLGPGYCGIIQKTPLSSTPGIIYSMGQRGAFAYQPWFGNGGAIYWVTTGNDGDDYIQVVQYDCATDTKTSSAKLYGQYPTAMCACQKSSSSEMYLATVRAEKEAGQTGYDPMKTYIYKAVTSSFSGGWYTRFDSGTSNAINFGNQYLTILEMITDTDDAGVLISGLRRGESSMYYDDANYITGKIGKDATNSIIVAVNGPYGTFTSASQVCGMINASAYVSASGYKHWAVSGDGYLLRYNGTSWVNFDAQSTLVDGEPYTTCPLAAWTSSTNPSGDLKVFGVSSPFPSSYSNDAGPDLPTFAPGKYYLWKVDKYIADRFELADFSGWTVWEAIGKIAEAIHHSAYFDSRGQFRLNPIGSSSSPRPYDVSGQDSSMIHMPWMTRPKMSLGLREVYNIATAVPYTANFQDPDNPVLRLNGGGDLNTTDNPPVIEVDSRSTYPVRIALKCVKGGRLLHPEAGQQPKFQKDSALPVVDLVLVRNTTPGTTALYVDSIPLDENGDVQFSFSATPADADYVTIGDRDYWQTSDRRVTGADTTTGTITVSPAVNTTNDPDSPYPPGTSVRIFSRENGADGAGNVYTFADDVPVGIGHGVTVRMRAGVERVDDEPWFHEGDTLIIEAPGLKLEKAERSIQTVTSTASIRAHQKREVPSSILGDNKMLGHAHALELARLRVNEYNFPRLSLSGGSFRFIPNLGVLESITLRDPDLLSHMANQREDFYVRSVEHDLDKLTTRVDMRGESDQV